MRADEDKGQIQPVARPAFAVCLGADTCHVGEAFLDDCRLRRLPDGKVLNEV